MKYKQNKAQHYSSMYKGLNSKTKKFLIIGIVFSIVFVSALTITAGFFVYKAGSLIVNTVKIENPNFEMTSVDSLIQMVMNLQSDVQNTLLSKECKTSLQNNLNVATFVMQPLNTIFASVKKDCTKPDANEAEKDYSSVI